VSILLLYRWTPGPSTRDGGLIDGNEDHVENCIEEKPVGDGEMAKRSRGRRARSGCDRERLNLRSTQPSISSTPIS